MNFRSKCVIFLILILFLATSLKAKMVDTAWTKTFGGRFREKGYSVQQTTDGGYIVTGYTESYGAGNYDVYLIKTDSLGDTLWTKTFGGSNQDEGYSVQQTTDGGYILAGYTKSYGAGSMDVYLIKTDPLGDTLWTRTFGGSAADVGYSVQQINDGGYIVVGSETSWGGGSSNVYLIKTDSLGGTLWTRIFESVFFDVGYSIQQTKDEGYIIAGQKGSNITDVYLIKTDSLGYTLWTKTFGGSNQDKGCSVQQTTDGGYIVAGYTASYGAGNYDVYLIKTDSHGDTLWAKTFGGSKKDEGYSVQQTNDGGYIVAGYTESYGADVYLIKTDPLGDTLWTETFGTSNADEGHSVQQTQDGRYIVAGCTYTSSAGANWWEVYLMKIEFFPDITITSPNGGEEWQGNSIYNITWTSYETSGRVKIEYSLNNGLNWTELIANTPDDGSYLWTVPDTMSYNCLINISDTNGSLSDTSDEMFTIFSNPIITLISPNGGEIWQANNAYDITWMSAGTSGNLRIEYSTNSGLDWITIADTVPDEKTYSWTIPFTPSDICLVRIADLVGSLSDISDSVFTIFHPPFITVTSPNGGEDLHTDSTHDITWTSYETSGVVKIEYSLNNGLDWTEITAGTPDDDSYLWPVPDTMSDNCLISISDTNGSLADTSNGIFTIFSDPFITVISPNGGEEWHMGEDHDIKWSSAGTSGSVRIEYSINNGSDWTIIADSVLDDETYSWYIPWFEFDPDTVWYSDSCLVRIADINDIIADTSDETFSIFVGAGVPTTDLPENYSLNVRGIAISSQLEFNYALPEETNVVRFAVYNIAGSKIKEEVLKESPAGFYSGNINMNGISKGIYFIRMEVNGGKFTQTKKFLLM